MKSVSRAIQITLLMAASVFVSGCSSHPHTATVYIPAPTPTPIETPAPTAGSSFLLKDQSLSRAVALASSGDMASMRALFYHYGLAIGDDEQARSWAVRAGDAGDMDLQQQVLCDYARVRDAAKVVELEKRWGVTSACRPRGGT